MKPDAPGGGEVATDEQLGQNSVLMEPSAIQQPNTDDHVTHMHPKWHLRGGGESGLLAVHVT